VPKKLRTLWQEERSDINKCHFPPSAIAVVRLQPLSAFCVADFVRLPLSTQEIKILPCKNFVAPKEIGDFRRGKPPQTKCPKGRIKIFLLRRFACLSARLARVRTQARRATPQQVVFRSCSRQTLLSLSCLQSCKKRNFLDIVKPVQKVSRKS
jgi:hypothetical protein